MKSLVGIIIGYLIGSIPTGVLIVRRIKPEADLRSIGSGNIGATNVSRVLGVKWGVVTMIGDCLKGLLPVLFARWIGVAPVAVVLAGIAAFLGHIYPVFLRLKGGKGVATAFGVFLGIVPVPALFAFSIWASASYIAGSTAAGALSAALAIPILVIGTATHGPFRAFAIITAFILALMVFYTHRENIRKIIRGNFKPGKTK
jgi:glycerol-3-phosphate acyltransferase PlsY